MKNSCKIYAYFVTKRHLTFLRFLAGRDQCDSRLDELAADTNLPPDYVVGFPPCAEVLILKDWPRPLPFLLADGSFHVNASGPDGAWFCVQTSSNLVDWTCISTNQAFQGSVDFVDPGAPNYSSRFYNTVPVMNTPGN
jgi:hypothetical protein